MREALEYYGLTPITRSRVGSIDATVYEDRQGRIYVNVRMSWRGDWLFSHDETKQLVSVLREVLPQRTFVE